MNILKKHKRLGIPPNIVYALIIVLVLISVVNIFTLGRINNVITGKIKAFEYEKRPAEIKVTRLLYQDCEDCYDLDQALDQIKNLDVKVIEERDLQWGSPQARLLISEYGIDVLPTIVITGETKKKNVQSSWKQIGELKDDDTVIFTKQTLPYYDVAKQEVVGLVTVTNLVDSSCTQCIDMAIVADTFRRMGVTISSEETLEYDSSEAKVLIGKFGVQKIPSLIISRDITEYDAVNQVWDQLDTDEKEGFYVLHATQPPYRDLETGEISGLVRLVNLVDSSCPNCYNVSLHEGVLQRFGVAVINTTTHDINSTDGRVLIEKYNITKVPTILLSPETSVYSSLTAVWSQAGSIEDDGWYIFRELSVLGDNIVYKDLV